MTEPTHWPSIFGLTGGIACGKSTVAAFLQDRGVGIVDADLVAREIVQPGTEALSAIVQAFGEQVLTPAGELDRKALGARVFGDEAARQTLNRLTHPRIRQASLDKARLLGEAGHRLVAYEAALLVEAGQAEQFRPLVVVTVSLDLQLARLRQRDGLTESEALARVAAQMPLAEKAAVADHVIDTSGSLEGVRARADAVLESICERVGLRVEEL